MSINRIKKFNNFLINRKFSLNRTFIFLIISILIFVIIWSVTNLFYLSIIHWIKPTLYADSYRLVEQGNEESFLKWIFIQHNEHRIVLSKLSVLIEKNILKIAPGQSGLFQNFSLVLLSGGIWTLININLFKNEKIKLISVLSGIVLLVHPWQWQNFIWEFQVPWFFTNNLVLLGGLILVGDYKPKYNLNLKSIIIFLIPWFSIFSTGQGIAVAFALSISALIKDLRLGFISIISSFFSLLTFFYFLNYSKPGFHPSYSFNLKFFFGILFGGIWHGLFILIIIAIFSYFISRPTIHKDKLATLLLPSIFSASFAFMTTLSRSEFGLRVAGSSRYTTHTLMIGLSAILLLSIIAESRKNKIYKPIIGISTLLITLGAFPQSLMFKNFRGDSFIRLWDKMYSLSSKNRQDFLCISDKIAFKKKGIDILCNSSPHHKDLAPAYLKNELIVKPQGWHKLQTLEELHNKKNQIKIYYKFNKINFNPQKGLQISGWVTGKSNNRLNEKIYLVANYYDSKKIFFLASHKNIDGKINNNFYKFFPNKYQSKQLKNITIETRNSSEKIWENFNIQENNIPISTTNRKN